MHNVTLALPVGFQLDQFRIESVLGKGGFGITYVATDLRLNKKVALKELLPDSIVTRVEGNTVVPHSQSSMEGWEWARERFLDEATRLASFSHPAIVGVHHFLEANGTAYMVMDFVDGESYEARLRRIGKEPDEGSLMAVMGPLMDGLGEVHAKGLLHRDIKPDNILINRRGQPILIDFGAAREVVGATVSMTSIVTHGYSPFEQYQGNAKLGPSADIYSLGAVMCRAVTGEKPPVGTERVLEDSFAPLATRQIPGFSIGFLDCIDRALAVRAEHRPQSIAEFKAAIQGQQGTIRLQPVSAPITPLPAPPPIPASESRSKKNPIAPLLAVAAVLLVLGVGFFGVMAFSKNKQNDSAPSNAGVVAENTDRGNFIPAPPPSSPPSQALPLPPQSSSRHDESTQDQIQKELIFSAKQKIKSGVNSEIQVQELIRKIERLQRGINPNNPSELTLKTISKLEGEIYVKSAFLNESVSSVQEMMLANGSEVELAWIGFKGESSQTIATLDENNRKRNKYAIQSFAQKAGLSYP